MGFGRYNSAMPHTAPRLRSDTAALFGFVTVLWLALAPALLQAAEELAVQITKKGLGKEVVMTLGAREWYMLVEVTPENTVVVRQEKEGEKYLLDESETHDRPLAPVEVDGAITDYVNSVKARVQKK